MPDQLVFPFGVKHALGRDDFIAAPCNEHALRFIERWPDWPARAAAIFGPAQSGKTHLAEIWCARTSAKRLSGAGLMLDALGISGDAALALELTETHLPDVERDRLLLALLDRPKGFLLLTAREPPSEWIVSVADLKSRLDALLSFALWTPDDALLGALARKHFAGRQLEVSEAVVTRLVGRLERTPAAVAAFIARADAKALAEKRAVTERLVMELLEADSG